MVEQSGVSQDTTGVAGRRCGPCTMRRPRAGLAPCVRDALGLPSAPTKWGRPQGLDGVGRTRAKARGNRWGPIPQGSTTPSVRAPEARSRGAKSPPMTKPSLRKLGWVERRKARVSPLARRCAPVSSRDGIGNRDVALRGAPSPSINHRGMRTTGAPGAGQTIRAMMLVCMSSARKRGLFDNRIGGQEHAQSVMAYATLSTVMAGLDPAIQLHCAARKMDARVKPAHDVEGPCGSRTASS